MTPRRFILTITALAAALTLQARHALIDGCVVNSSIFPGTVHSFQVYVPEQYDGSQAAALYVGLDGVLCNAPAVMDSLIAAGKMPCTIGVFVQPGLVKDGDGNVVRYNRCFEFDFTTDALARFLEAELLPAVESMTVNGDVPVRLSREPGDRMIFGLSSGGIAAFNAAWHRPDLFGKVFTGVGTFVAMRGGNDLQALVRKTEPLPLRVFVQDGSNDAWNPLFGHWYENNQLMASALEFAGCDVKCDWSDGGHNVKRATEIFADVMQWMWRDWPERPATGKTQNDFLQALLIDGQAGWTTSTGDDAARPYSSLPPSAYYPDSTLMALAEPMLGNAVWQYVVHGNKRECGEPFYWLHNDDNSRPVTVNAMAFDGGGNLWVVTGRMGIQICDQNGRVRAILRTPAEASPVTAITIGDGTVTLHTPAASYTRRFNVAAPVPGQRPKSQGQG